ncbi:hypothetical protein [Paucibacter soli]|uniref:hypothetical protein n=1 Tax=Paucibacter soli TaxID=3133433 RepID=UPI0030A78DAC
MSSLVALGGTLRPGLDAAPAGEVCLYCGGAEQVELHEVWGPREFMLETCCEGMHEAAADYLAEDPKRAAQWLGQLGINDVMRGMPGCSGGLRRVIESDGQLLLDWNLDVSRDSCAGRPWL